MNRVLLLAVFVLVTAACSTSVVIEQVQGQPAVSAVDAPTVDAPTGEAGASEAAGESDSAASNEIELSFGSGSISADGRVIPAGAAVEPDRFIDPSLNEESIAAQINATVPADVNLTFVWDTLRLTDDGHTARALVPVGWELDEGFSFTYESDDFGFFTEYEIDAGCQGFCAPQDWAKLLADPEVSPFALGETSADAVVLINQQLSDPAGRLVVYDLSALQNTDAVKVIAVRWSDDADRFFECSAGLEDEDFDLWPTFADACLVAVGDWLG